MTQWNRKHTNQVTGVFGLLISKFYFKLLFEWLPSLLCTPCKKIICRGFYGKSDKRLFFNPTGGERELGSIHQHFTCSFYSHRSKKQKKTCHFKLLFLLSGSAGVKAAHKHVDEIDPSFQYHCDVVLLLENNQFCLLESDSDNHNFSSYCSSRAVILNRKVFEKCFNLFLMVCRGILKKTKLCCWRTMFCIIMKRSISP